MRFLSEAGKQWFKELEGLRQMAYLDSGGVLTIGLGHRLTISERRAGKIIVAGMPLPYRNGLTTDQCWMLFEQDLTPVAHALATHVTVPLTQHQHEALLAFTFNVGIAAFLDSTLLRLLNHGLHTQVPTQLARWIYDDGVVVPGLMNRRKQEIAWWRTADAVVLL